MISKPPSVARLGLRTEISRTTWLVASLLLAACGDSDPMEEPGDAGNSAHADTSNGAGADAVTQGDAASVVDVTDSGDAEQDGASPVDALEQEDTLAPYEFILFAPEEIPADVLVDRLCAEAADPEAAADKINITCRYEGSNDLPAPADPGDAITVMTWNLERGVNLDAMLEFFDSGTIPVPDILLASELDRGCSRSGSRDVARILADTLGYNYVFGVEYTELPRLDGAGGTITSTCEHGNAIFSRFPLGNVDVRFHESNRSWYLPPDQRDDGEPRLGGRSFVQADVDLGSGHYLRLFTVHFESNPIDIEYQLAQATEVADRGAEAPIPAIIAGDTNNVAYFIDVARGRDDVPERVVDRTVRVFLDRGFVDPHRTLGQDERATRSGLVIDLIFGSDDRWRNPQVCPPEICSAAISDHQPVWAEYLLP